MIACGQLAALCILSGGPPERSRGPTFYTSCIAAFATGTLFRELRGSQPVSHHPKCCDAIDCFGTTYMQAPLSLVGAASAPAPVYSRYDHLKCFVKVQQILQSGCCYSRSHFDSTRLIGHEAAARCYSLSAHLRRRYRCWKAVELLLEQPARQDQQIAMERL